MMDAEDGAMLEQPVAEFDCKAIPTDPEEAIEFLNGRIRNATLDLFDIKEQMCLLKFKSNNAWKNLTECYEIMEQIGEKLSEEKR